MKPIIISAIEVKDGYVRLKKEDFERYIQDAYEFGVKDGSSHLQVISPWESNLMSRERTTRNLIEITCIGV